MKFNLLYLLNHFEFVEIFCRYLKTLEWILIYSTVPITFHIITNEGSITYLNTLSDLLNKTSNCDFEIDFVTLESIVEKSTEIICPKLKMQKDFCDVVMGSMTPLIFPYLFPDLDHVIYVNRELVSNRISKFSQNWFNCSKILLF